MNESWMNNHSVTENNCNTLNLQSPPKNLQEMTNNVGLMFSLRDTIPGSQLVNIEQDNQNWLTLNTIFSVH